MTMDVHFAPAFAGVLGSFVGASAAVATGWISQRTLNKREILREEISKRETLYGEFIAECAKLFMDAFMHTLDKPETLLPALALINRIRVSGSNKVLAEAENVLTLVTQQYFASNLTVDELRKLALAREADPLKPFGDACRLELKAMQKRL